jgi:hypothetical protein
MSVFDLLFIVVFVSTLVAIVVIGVAAILGRRALARRIVAVLAAAIALYLSVVIVVSIATPRRVLPLGHEQCFDDWCVSVVDVKKKPAAGGALYTVAFRVISRARHRAQRGLNTVAYMIDDAGKRYDPLPSDAVPFDVLLNPQQEVITERIFELPETAPNPVIVVSHGAGFPGWFIIGDANSLFHRPTVVQFD